MVSGTKGRAFESRRVYHKAKLVDVTIGVFCYYYSMAERLLVQPPEIVETTGPVIFLAGPIQGAPDWQSKATSTIHAIDPSIIVASPRRDYPEETFVYEKQVDWETHYLQVAGSLGVIAFWLAAQEQKTSTFRERFSLHLRQLFRPATIELPRSYAQTTRFELAEWKMHHQYEGAKITLGIEDGFGNARYIRRRFDQDCPDVKIASSLPEMCQNAVDLLRQSD